LLGAGHVLPGDGRPRVRLQLGGLDPRHDLDRPPEQVGDEPEEQDRDPDDRVVRDPVPEVGRHHPTDPIGTGGGKPYARLATTSAAVANSTPRSRQTAVQAATRDSSRPRAASSTKRTRRPRSSSPRIAASSQTSVATPKTITSSGSSRRSRTSAFGFVKTSKR